MSNTSWKIAFAAAVLSMGTAASVPALAQETTCGTDRKIDIAEMDWASASAIAHIHNIILSEGYGCNAEIVPGNTVPTSASMIGRGQPAIAPELWMSSIEEAWDQGEAEGTVVELGPAITDGTVEGIFIPTAVAEAEGIKTIDDAIARPDLFQDAENPDKGRIYGGPPGWAADLAVSALFEAYEMEEKGWNLFSVGSATLAASAMRAFVQEEPIMFYYWGPTAVLGSVDATKFEMPTVDMDIYTCNTNSDCDEPAGKSDWPSSRVIVGAAGWVAEEAPVVAEYFSKVGLSNDQISKLLVFGLENQAGGEETAENFLNTEDVWMTWVPADVAERVKASLS